MINLILPLLVVLLSVAGPMAALFFAALYRQERAETRRLNDELALYNAALQKATDDWLIERSRPRITLPRPCACGGLPQAMRNVSVN